MPWDDNNVAKLRDLWDQGLPTAVGRPWSLSLIHI